MKIFFYLTAAILFTCWSVSVFVYGASDLIHSLLAFVIISITLGVMDNEKRPVPIPVKANRNRF